MQHDSRRTPLGSGAMSFVLQQLHSKEEVDSAILGTPDKVSADRSCCARPALTSVRGAQVLVLRFGRVTDPGCMVVDDMVSAAP